MAPPRTFSATLCFIGTINPPIILSPPRANTGTLSFFVVYDWLKALTPRTHGTTRNLPASHLIVNKPQCTYRTLLNQSPDLASLCTALSRTIVWLQSMGRSLWV